MMDEHTDWINKIIYLPESHSLLSCSNDTTIKLWKIPEDMSDTIPIVDAFTATEV